MKRVSIVLLQVVIVALGIAVLAALLYEPTVEGVNANATSLYEIYLDDPFLAYIYFSFIAVFVGLYQAFKLLGYIGRDEGYSLRSAQALRTIKYCSRIFGGLIFSAVAFIVIFNRGEDDIAGGVAVGLFLTVTSLVIAATAAMFERKSRKRIHAS